MNSPIKVVKYKLRISLKYRIYCLLSICNSHLNESSVSSILINPLFFKTLKEAVFVLFVDAETERMEVCVLAHSINAPTISVKNPFP